MDTQIAATMLVALCEGIANPAMPDADLIEHVLSVRKQLDGVPIDIKQVVINATDVGEQLRSLETINAQLAERLQEAEKLSTMPKPENGCYTMEQFLTKLHCHRSETYAWRVDYIKATNTTPGVRAVRNEEIQQWRKKDEVPTWAYEEVSLLVFPKRKSGGHPTWKTTEYDYLCREYLIDPSRSNLLLSQMCSLEFGRPITEQAIKGSLDRLRKRNRIPERRPSKTA